MLRALLGSQQANITVFHVWSMRGFVLAGVLSVLPTLTTAT